MRLPSDTLPKIFAGRLLSNTGLLSLGLLSLILGKLMRTHSDALIGPASPLGILSLQFTCSADAANAILGAWDSPTRLHARMSLYWDMGFAPAYGITLTALTQRYFAWHTRNSRPFPVIIAWLPLWAALADWLENLFHLYLISANGYAGIDLLAPLACGTALLKWSLLIIWLLGLGWTALRKPATA